MDFQTIYAHGKLLLTAEYAVLDGALALAIPTKFGQKFLVKKKPSNSNFVKWKSFDSLGNIWLDTTYPKQNPQGEEVLLHTILDFIKENNADFSKNEYEIEAHLEFPRNWGLGSSATLIYFLGKYFSLNPFKLNEQFFKGSGYDIACAGEDTPIKFMKKNGEFYLNETEIDWDFKKHLYFVFLGNKKNSREAITHYKKEQSSNDFIQKMNELTNNFLSASCLNEFQQLMVEHENLLSERLQTKPVKDILFQDLKGAVKSLGAWGGDFVLVATEWSEKELIDYLNKKAMDVVIPFDEMIFKK